MSRKGIRKLLSDRGRYEARTKNLSILLKFIDPVKTYDRQCFEMYLGHVQKEPFSVPFPRTVNHRPVIVHRHAPEPIRIRKTNPLLRVH